MNQIAMGEYQVTILSTQNNDFAETSYAEVEAAGLVMLEAVIASGAQPILLFDYNTRRDDRVYPPGTVEAYYSQLHATFEEAVINGTTHNITAIPVLHLYERGKATFPNWMRDDLHGGEFAQYCTGALIFKFLTHVDPDFTVVHGEFSVSERWWCERQVRDLFAEFQ